MKKIYVCGKEGSGKTTIAVNLALELQKSGKRTALVDMNLHSPHASLCFGITPHKTLNDFLDGAAEFSEIIHRHESGLDIVLSSLKRFETDADLHRIEKDLESNFRNHDFVLIDAGFPLDHDKSDSILFIATPNLPSVVEIERYKEFLGNARILGIVINMQKGIGLTAKEIAHFTEIPVIGIVPYDDAVAEATNKRKPLVIKDNGRAAEALRKIASKLALTK